jgi:hypothetical protein
VTTALFCVRERERERIQGSKGYGGGGGSISKCLLSIMTWEICLQNPTITECFWERLDSIIHPLELSDGRDRVPYSNIYMTGEINNPYQ